MQNTLFRKLSCNVNAEIQTRLRFFLKLVHDETYVFEDVGREFKLEGIYQKHIWSWKLNTNLCTKLHHL